MFTGIIQKKGRVLSTESRADSLQLTLQPETPYRDLALGESISINGACLTVAEFTPSGQISFFVSPETLRVSTLRSFKPGRAVSLERALTLSSRLSGHWVQGHVDGVAQLISVIAQNESYELELDIPKTLSRYCILKGSIALDGISLTLHSVTDGAESRIKTMIIPYSWSHTHLSELKPGDFLNVEVDLIAKYIERLCQIYPKP